MQPATTNTASSRGAEAARFRGLESLPVPKMESNQEVPLNCIYLPTRLKKLKRPAVSLLNEYEHFEDIDYDVFERNEKGNYVIVELPSNLTELREGLVDLTLIMHITSLKYEIGRDTLRLAVHLFYRIILKEKNYNYHDFILYYEQYNKSWIVFSDEYHMAYNKWKNSIRYKNKEMQCRSKLTVATNEQSENIHLLENLVINHNSVEPEERAMIVGNKPIESTGENIMDDEGAYRSSLSSSSQEPENCRSDGNEENKKCDKKCETRELGEIIKDNQCFCIDEDTGCLNECNHSKFVLYQLFKTGDFLMATGDDMDEHRQCNCYRTKCSVIREVHPFYRDLAWGHKHLCFFKYWCFINCLIQSQSLKMLKTIHPHIECLKEGILVPFSPSDVKRLSLKTFALKSIICNYVNIHNLVILSKRQKV